MPRMLLHRIQEERCRIRGEVRILYHPPSQRCGTYVDATEMLTEIFGRDSVQNLQYMDVTTHSKLYLFLHQRHFQISPPATSDPLHEQPTLQDPAPPVCS